MDSLIADCGDDFWLKFKNNYREVRQISSSGDSKSRSETEATARFLRM